ncbi:MAG: chemotaxis protein CheA [Beggiatoa sp. IS2]|nr:MAG: chemotaxis protein CheA [Beggiatoa sp. IS2]
MTVDMTEVRQLFFEESFENLDAMESNLLDLEVGAINQELINNIFRAAHSIKGGAGIFKFEHVVAFAHTAETLLGEMRSGEHTITQPVIDVLLRSVDTLRLLLSALQEDQEYDHQQLLACQEELKSLLQTPMEGPSSVDIVVLPKKVVEKPAEPTVETPIQMGWHLFFKPYPSMLKTGNDPLYLFRELSHLGQLEVTADISQLPHFEAIDPQACYLSWELTLLTDVPLDTVQEIFEWVEGDCELRITPLNEDAPPAVVRIQETTTACARTSPSPPATLEPTAVEGVEEAVAIPAQTTAHIVPTPSPIPKFTPLPAMEDPLPTKPEAIRNNVNQAIEASSIRVSIDKIDALINMVGELVITQSMLDQVGESFDGNKMTQLHDGLAQLGRNTRELQENVMRIRMLPISFSFNRFPRLVHDLSNHLGKKVELKLSGENTELDKTVLEKMSDPLVHLVRNALDHGIEMPEQRRAAGKSETGLLHLHAFHQGGSVVVQVSDNGAGFDLEKIRDKAIQQGIFTLEDNPTEEQLYEIVFQPGFSTAVQVSDLSGRGVGMDVVRRNIRALGGTIGIQSKPGQGTIFSIRLPLTLAILDGQLVRVGEEIYILSLLSILESLRIEPRFVNVVAGKAEVYKLRDEYIPIVRLYVLFGIEPGATQLEHGLLVVVEGDGQKIGLFVDELLSQQQIVVKGLETNYKQVEGVSGATILGDGSVSLILDVAGLIRLFQQPRETIKKNIQLH